jgi:MoaA/NifB/PqqE/SkfB family radical SAM enzyme
MTDIHSLSPHAALAVAGGEPLMRPDLKEIFYFIQNNLSGMNIELLSNATLIDQDNIGWLMDTVRGFNISMEGATPLVHDAVRGRGTFQRTFQALKLLVGQGAVVAVRMTYFHQGEDESENLMRFIQDIRISMFNSRYLVPVGRASEKKVDADQYRRLSERIWEVGRELGIKVGYSDPFPELLVNEKRKKEIDDNVDLLEGVAGCSIAFTLQYITPQGTGGAVSLFSCLCCRYTRRKA